MTATVQVRNRQKTARVQSRYLGQIAREVLDRVASGRSGALGIYLVETREIIRLNETFLRHAGPTDVIAFDYIGTGALERPARLHAEIFICVEEAMSQARRFRAGWPEEVVRCMIHGMLHLAGHDDARAARRRKMKRVENRLLKEMKQRFPWQPTELRPLPRRSH